MPVSAGAEQLGAEVAHVVTHHGLRTAGSDQAAAGHLGHVPVELRAGDESIDGDRIESYIAPGSDGPMRRPDRAGRACHWILEVHLVDRRRGFGGFFEQLLTLRTSSAA